jgi:hypothetical protein
MNDFSGTLEEVESLFSPETIRDRAEKIFKLAEKGKTQFSVDLSKLPAVADRVAKNTKKNYPTLQIPFHSRWKHFQVGGLDRNKKFETLIEGLSNTEKTFARIDLALVSVLLDAGAGPHWKFSEKDSGLNVGKSEGLALASRQMFLDGAFSYDPSNHPLRVDFKGLRSLTLPKLSDAFQVSVSNALVGLEGRLQLLQNLSHTLEKRAGRAEGTPKPPLRLAHLILSEAEIQQKKTFSFVEILRRVQKELGPIWPGRLKVSNISLGDVWAYPPLGRGIDGLVPFHKLSQWIVLSLAYAFEKAELKLTESERLTGLPEYRNGGLFVDMGVLNLRNPKQLALTHAVQSEFIVEWRALTIACLDRLAPLVRELLKKSESELPLGCILEGGTWSTGREIALEKRPPLGASPISVKSDGTVF